MSKLKGRNLWIACSVAGAILVGCISEVGDAALGTAADAKSTGAASVLRGPSGNTNGGGGCCPDVDGSGFVDLADLATFLSVFGTSSGPSCFDFDNNGVVDLSDLATMLSLFGQPCDNGNGNANGGNGNANGGNGNANGGNGNANGGNGNANGGNGNANGGNGNANGGNGNANGGNGNANGGNGNANGGNGNANGGNGNANGGNGNANGGNGNANGGNGNANGGNGNANGGNGNANGGNGNANGGNGNANGGNGNANGGNGNANGGNGNANGGNGNANGGNGNANGGNGNANGDCPDGTTQVEAQLSGDSNNEARYREFPSGCRHFRVRVRDLAAFTTYNVVIEGAVVGQLTTDDRGRGELEFNSPNFPAGFPHVIAGDVISVGPRSGVFFNNCSANANCNG